jgi:hypothetical protein
MVMTMTMTAAVLALINVRGRILVTILMIKITYIPIVSSNPIILK